MFKLVLFLDDPTAKLLSLLAEKEYRDIRSQATLMLKEELARRQSLPPETDSFQFPERANQNQFTTNQIHTEEDHEQPKK